MFEQQTVKLYINTPKTEGHYEIKPSFYNATGHDSFKTLVWEACIKERLQPQFNAITMKIYMILITLVLNKNFTKKNIGKKQKH